MTDELQKLREAWEALRQTSIRTEGGAVWVAFDDRDKQPLPLPYYTTDDALDLCAEVAPGFSLADIRGEGGPGNWEASLDVDDGTEYGHSITRYAATPAEALARLALAVLEREESND